MPGCGSNLLYPLPVRSRSFPQAVGPASLHLALVLLATAACGDSSSDAAGGAPPTTSTATSSVTGATKSGVTSATGATTSATSGTGGAAPMTEEVHVVARTTDDGGTQVFAWSGGSIRTTVDGDGSGVDFVFEGAGGIYFQIAVDGVPTQVVESDVGSTTFTVGGLMPGQHEIEVVRRNEGYFGNSGLVSVTPRDGSTLVATPVRARRIELIGDSLTAGYGIEGPNASCNFSAETESAYSTYGMIAARALDADAHVIAWSGKGVYQNYGGDRNEMMPELWRRTLAPFADPAWDFSRWVPQAVVVNLGTNDFSAAIADEDFVGAYVDLLTEVRMVYPDAHIFCVTWNHWGAAKEALVSDAIAETGLGDITRVDFGILQEEGLGCDSHTNTVTNARLGTELAATIGATLGW